MVQELEKSAPGVELLIIDDGSPDGTAAAVKELQKQKSFIHLIE